MVTAAGDAHGHGGGGRSGASYQVRWTRLDEVYLKVAAQGPKGHRNGVHGEVQRRPTAAYSGNDALGRKGRRGDVQEIA